MELIILTSSSTGSSAYIIQELIKSKSFQIKMVVINQGKIKSKTMHRIKKLKKIFRIGFFGALNGIKMRKWYNEDVIKYLNDHTIPSLCKEHNIPFKYTSNINSEQTINIFKDSKADLGISLGNGYIRSKIFRIPKQGMINIHHEELPKFQNAQSIIWQIYNQSKFTGYTIHKIDKNIDTGDILLKERLPIIIRPNLGDTVSYNYSELIKKSSIGLIKVLTDFKNYNLNCTKQGKGRIYTTPSIWQYLQILKRFKSMKKNEE